ncbi:MBG domain-containing protein [Pinibacter aurantiacus]|uniref:Ig domain-containing protein n=1 Tax=Pinibacter aurantiacus TaxID=2851599 RepID=A0A9E2W4K8_9BACT|nr:MBG domain-containing protein [Pinibacter aurantiacus]MBV4357603.1 putative Ig domain-containing protein [Pinibacter aurantiacus]
MRQKLYLSILLLLLTSSLFSQSVKLTDCNETSTVTLNWSGSEFSGSGSQGTWHLYPVGGTWMLMLGNAGDLRYHNLSTQDIPTSYSSGTGNWYKDAGCALSTLTVLAAAEVTTGAVNSVTFTTATMTGNVSFAGNGPVSEKGIVYSTSSSPDINDTKLTNGTGTGAISVNASSLSPGTTYYVRAYATNATGTAYGPQLSFTTPAPVTVSSVTETSPHTTNASTVTYKVIFSTSVTNVTAAAFDLTMAGLSGASVSSVSGSGTTYTVTVNTGSGDGGISLVVNGTGMSSVPTNAPYSITSFYQIDKTAPTTTITSAPPALTNSTNASFSFTSSETPSTFQAHRDAGAYITVTAPLTYTGLAAGTHTFYVMAKDAAGNTSVTPATYTWTIDDVAPTAPMVITPLNGGTSTTTTPSYTGTAEMNTTINVIVDGSSIGTTTADASGNWNLVQPTALVSGAHNVQATATDAAGNTSVNSNTNTFTVSLLSISPSTIPAPAIASAYSQTLSASNGTTPYSFALTAGSLPAGLTLSPSLGIISGTATAGGVFNFTVTVTDATAKTATRNYSITVGAPTISVSPTTLPAGDQNVAYTATTVTASGGTSPYSYAVTSGTLPAGLTLNPTTGILSGTPTASGPSVFTITATDASSGVGPYTGSRGYTMTVNSLPTLTLSALPVSTYGDADLTLSASSTNPGPAITYTSMNTSIATIVGGNKVHIIAAGNVVIKASQAGDVNHGAPVDAQQTLVINQKTLTITAAAASKMYGTADPALTFTSSALVNGDVVTGNVVRAAGNNVGTYAITQGTVAASSNYAITYVGANFNITPAPLTVIADDKTKVYGASIPTLTISYNGWVAGDDASSFTTAPMISVPAVASSAVGLYPITASGAVNPNYTIGYQTGHLTITNAALTITADDQTKVYGANVPALTASYSGWVNGDNTSDITTLPIVSTTATSASAVGNYPVTASGAVVPNYDITYAQGNLSVTPATLTITAYDASKVYGDNNPALLVTYNGWVNGDDESDITTLVKVTTTATVSSPVGNYPITPSQAVAPNYTINFVAGNLSVTPAALTITADDKTKVYGANNPALTASYTGFVNGENASSLTTAPTITTTATPSSVVGNYPVTASGAVDANYTITYVPGNLSVTPAVLTITADDKTKIYGENNPALTVHYSGFVNNDDPTTLTTAPTVTTTATAASSVGDYPIGASGAADANYTIIYVNGKLSITPAALTVTAEDKTKAYGAVLPTFTATYSGWVNGDGVSSLTTAPTITTTATAASNVGNYPITAASAVNPNYNITYVAGNLSITAVPLNITAENKTKVYGDADPALTYVATGWVNGDGTSVITGLLKRIAGENVSSYAINQNTLSAGNNYIITYTAGNFTITPATLTITANAQTKVYGTADPALTYVATGWKNGDGTSVITGGLTRVAGENAGTYAIQQGTVGAGSNYIISYVGNNLTITKAPQVITWVQDLTIGCTTDILPVQLNATVNSGLTISYGISSTDVATISGNSLTPVLPGHAVITASQAGDANHFAAPSVTNNVNYRSASAVRQHWSDVLMFDNSSNNYTKWEWYKNNSLVSGQTSAYYSEPSALSGTYYVIATDKNGEAIQSCPLTLNGSATVTAGIKVYPNPVTAGSSATVTCTYTDAALQGAKMAIVDMSGKIQQEITNVKATQTITAPSARGLYYITLLLKNGAKASVNLLVK